MRELTGKTKHFIYVYVILMGFFHLYTAIFGSFEAFLQRAIHLSWVLPLGFLLYPATGNSPKDRIPLYDWGLALLAALPGLYLAVNFTAVATRIVQVDPVTTVQIGLAFLLVLLLMEGTRRVVGLPLALIAAFFAGYMHFGHFLPGIMKGLSFSIPEVAEQLFLTDEGIYSIPLGVSATFVTVFLIFGGFLEKSGIGAYFMEFAQAFAGTTPGGPAKIAVVSSCLFGSISGSAVANVYGTGTFTIPLMKRLGYAPHFAGAVEAVASSGGQIMPPIMGAGAFIMASLLGVQYGTVVVAAFIPAVLYYAAVFLMVHLRALKRGLQGLSPEDLPDKKDVLRRLYNLVPIVGLVWMLMKGYSPMLSAVIGIGMAWLASLPSREHRMGPKAVLDAIYSGAKNIPVVGIACASAGIIVGSVALTGFGFKFVGFVFSFAGDLPWLALFLIMVISLILGMGLPTTGAYILAAALGVPALAKMGFLPLSSHLFVFYFAIISAITPPVALAAYAASSVAGANPNATGFQAMRLGILAFIVPFAFCYDPGLILQGSALQNAAAVAGGAMATLAMGFAMEGYLAGSLSLWKRCLFFLSGLVCLAPTYALKGSGMALTAAAIFFFWEREKKASRQTAANIESR